MTKLSIILPSVVPSGGAEKLAILIARDQINRGNEVDFVLLNEPNDVKNVLPPEVGIFKYTIARFRNAFGVVFNHLRNERPDVVLASMWPLTVLVILANMMAGSPSRIVVSDHNPLSLQYSKWGRLTRALLKVSIWTTYSWADARVAVSKGVAEDVSKLSGLPLAAFKVIYNPTKVGLSTENGRAYAEKIWGPCKTRRILTVGRLKTQKNHKLLIEAFKACSEQCDAKLVILGSGELEAELRAFSHRLGVGESVFLIGYQEDVASWYESADLFVLSSDYEGFGNVMTEAMAAGLPVVSTDCPSGPAEILDNGKYGKLVPVNDARSLSKAILEALQEPSDPKRLKRRAAEISGAESLEDYHMIIEGTAR